MNQNKNADILNQDFGAQKRWVNYDGTTKIPLQINGKAASSTDPETWSTYDEVKKVSDKIGIIFMSDKKLLGIDIDHCLTEGEIIHEKKEIIENFLLKADTYTEISPSGTGLHCFISLTTPLTLIRNKKAPFEVYTAGRYFTVTGNTYKEEKQVRTVTPEEALELLEILGYPWGNEKVALATKAKVTELFLDDSMILEKMFSSKNGDKIKSLYNGDISAYGNDDSTADAALCSHLAFWTGRNAERIERLWLASPLGQREKTAKRQDYRDRTIEFTISNCKETYTGEEYGEEKQERGGASQANTLLEAIFGHEDVILFHNEQGDGFISMDINGHQEIWACGSKKIKKWIANEIYNLQKKTPKAEVIKSILAVLEGRACFDGPEIELQNRAAWLNGELWFDLTDKNWRAVKINKDGWEIVNKPPILFMRYPHHKAQAEPARNGDVKLFFNYMNIPNPKHKLLDLVSMISNFIPGFPHVMTVIFGPQGSAKTTHSTLKRSIIDPSALGTSSFPHSQRELIQALAHHYFLFFDNVTYITEDQSDTLCRAITGGGHVKRELYENDEDIIYNFRRCIGLNGINLITTRPDLLERSLLLELERIEPTKTRTEKELYDSFEKDLPSILGGIFDTLVKAINIFPTINLESHHRMADWEIWGCSIAEALGYTKEEFLIAYQDNITRQTEMLLSENIVATAVIVFMEDKDEWRGTPTELLRQLTTNASFAEIDTREKYWPRGANILSRRLNELSTPLKQMGYLVEINTTGAERYIRIQKISKDPTTQNDPTNKPDGTDDTDSKNW